MSVSASSLVQLAEQISLNAKELQILLESNSNRQDSSKIDTGQGYSKSAEDEWISQARLALFEANQAMMDVVLCPWDRLKLIIDSGKTNLAVVRTIDHFDIAKFVSVEGRITFEDLAKVAKVDRRLLECILRYCFTIHFFRESQPGQVAQTSLSAVIPAMSSWIRISTSEIIQQGIP